MELPAEPELPVLAEPLAAVELVEPVELPPVVEATEPEAVVVTCEVPPVVEVVAGWVSVLRASAGSCPVTSTIAISDHTAMNSATEPATTRLRIMRTRARRASLILMPSSLVMHGRIGPTRTKGV